MNRYSVALLLPIYLVSLGCSDEPGTPSEVDVDVSPTNEATDETSSAATSSSNDDSTTKREGPWGCYLQDHHSCDCSIKSEEDCQGVGLWTEGCASCAPSTETPNDTSSASDAGDPVETSADLDGGAVSDSAPTADQGDAAFSAGCYNPTQHTCACDTTETACLADDGIWTSDCECALQVAPTTSDAQSTAPVATSEVASDAATATDDAAASTAPSGNLACYLPTNHTCDCVMNESQCDTSDGIWTDECDSCFPADAGP